MNAIGDGYIIFGIRINLDHLNGYHSMNLRSRLLAVVSALIGLALFIYVIKQTGFSEIASNLRAIGSGFLLILAVSSTRYLLRSLAWLRCMNSDERRVGFWALWRARLAGEAVGDLTF